MDLARIDLLMRSGLWDNFRRQRWFPVVAGQTITYRKSLKLGQGFIIESRVLGMDERWFYIEQVFHHEGAVCARALIRLRFLKRGVGYCGDDGVPAVARRSGATAPPPQPIRSHRRSRRSAPAQQQSPVDHALRRVSKTRVQIGRRKPRCRPPSARSAWHRRSGLRPARSRTAVLPCRFLRETRRCAGGCSAPPSPPRGSRSRVICPS